MRLTKICACAEPCEHPLHYAFKHKGQLYRGTTHTGNSVLAKRMAEKIRQDVLASGVGLSVAWRAPGLSVHIKAYVEQQRDAYPRAAGRDARILAGFLAVVGDKRIDQVRAFDVERWRAARSRAGAGRSTIERNEHAVRGCFTAAAVTYTKQRFVSPCATLAPYKLDGTKRTALSLAQIAVVLQRLPPRLALICRVTLECLPRLSEVLGLRVSDLGPGRLSFRRKGGQVTTIQASPALVGELLVLAGDREYVFGDPTEEERRDLVAWLRATQTRTSGAFMRAFRAIGLKGISHHNMRHTGVTLMLERGENPRVIQQLAGWSTMRMLEKYGHVRDEAQQKAVLGNAAIVAVAQVLAIPDSKDATAIKRGSR